ncbi:uncharacterized protein MONBRDRAFT_27795 [Monosiga brevicollis MX1]|uniref:Amino acid transporter transmembrane domain-containing protein n=1 Tax=Monosiga brevicollis TaxID=81824 RepID=A9V6C3_MONBE|nr:uncharacterized protein MONBRDRAFT_27795 [Monosiga brevicollis MX1]EDQ86967.1 predicted protein [Monosiga brevicollis MX1]|eukprot:XP_001748206.1 hypothetical protein [Monosiga brevicollis MX1]
MTGDDFLERLQHDVKAFGHKTIGYFAGIALLINNITGPGVPSLANMFAESGWLIPTLVFLAVWLMSSISTTMYCEAMRRIPHNEHFRQRVEYTSVVKYYFGTKAYVAAQIGLSGALQSLNIISVVQSAQVMDNAISAIFHKSCGLNLSPFPVHFANASLPAATEFWSCIDTNHVDVDGNAWGCHVVLTAGYLFALLLTVPMGYFNLDDNMIVQAGVIGTVLFNYGFVTTVPSFINEKKPHVSVNKVTWVATFICVVVFMVMGLPGAFAFRRHLAGPATGVCEADPTGAKCASSLMDIFTTEGLAPAVLSENRVASGIMQTSVYLFPIVAILSSIPVFSIVIKYNMLENGFSKGFSSFWGVIFPWVVALPLLYQPDALNQFITFSSLIFVSFTDFIVPWALYMVLQNKHDHALDQNYDEDWSNDHDNNLCAGIQDVEDEESALLPLTKKAPFYIAEHFALPPSWNLSSSTFGARNTVLGRA